ILHVPCCDRSTIMPVVTTVECEAKIGGCVCKIRRVTIPQCCRSARWTTRVAEEAVAGRHPVNILQYRRTLVDTGARGRSLTAEWILHEETVIDIAHHITVPDGIEVERVETVNGCQEALSICPGNGRGTTVRVKPAEVVR